jgi:hypothetical protein
MSNLPKDFDWKYYLDTHPDLTKAGILSEQLAKIHYLRHGQREGRAYKVPQKENAIVSKIISDNSLTRSDKKSITDHKIILFLQWYLDDETEANRLKCLQKNIDNNHINHIHIFSDTYDINKILPLIKTKKNISISFIEDRLSYKAWIDYADKYFIDDIKVLINSDIYLDSTIQSIKQYSYSRHSLYAITRKDLAKNGVIQESKDFYAPDAPQTHPLYSHDCWIYKDKIKLSGLALSKIDLKLGYNNCDRLFKKFLTEEKINFVNLYPDINAIHIDYRTIKKHKEYDLNHISLTTPIYNIDQYLDSNKLIDYKNHLDCICLLLTGNEVIDGQYDAWIHDINNSIRYYEPNMQISKNLDLVIITHKKFINSININLIADLFKNIKILDINIPQEYDFYNDITDQSDLTYGYRSGPNYTFFTTFQHLYNYNTTLFLECDCYLSQDWLEKIYQYSKNSGSFWISGSTYDGYNMATYHDISNQHLNGGICLYATGCQEFTNFMKFCFNLLPDYVKYYLKGIPYDYLIYKIIEDYFNYDDKHKELWQFIKRKYTVNNLIYNYSTNSTYDTSIDLSYITKKYSAAIVHKKKQIKNSLQIEQCNNPPADFDHNFYFNEYPDTRQYYLIPNATITYTDKQRAYHHYQTYGRKLGYFRNPIDKKFNDNTKTKYINELISVDDRGV